MLRDHGIERVTEVGLATDYCVRATALDGLRLGFDVVVDRAGIRGIDVEPGDSERALAEVEAAGDGSYERRGGRLSYINRRVSGIGAFISPGKSLQRALDRVALADRLGYDAAYTTHIAGATRSPC